MGIELPLSLLLPPGVGCESGVGPGTDPGVGPGKGPAKGPGTIGEEPDGWLLFGMLSLGIDIPFGIDPLGIDPASGSCGADPGKFDVPGIDGPGVDGEDPPVAVNSETIFSLRVALSSV